MFDNLSNSDISTILEELISCFGVKEEIPFQDLLLLLLKKDTQGCVQRIASELGLPIRIILSYVPKDYRPGNTEAFRTSALSRTDWTGHGIESITAQVAMPRHLPMFGTSDLQGYPIQVRVSEDCHEHPETFVAIMAHELSHVLLAALYHPQKDNELHTDLIPIVLGFRDIVQKGRKAFDSSTFGDETTTRTITYGYLTDSQFDFACNHVRNIVELHQGQKERVKELGKKLHQKHRIATRELGRFRKYLRYLDTHPVKKMSQNDALRVVQFHGSDYTRDWEINITYARNGLGKAQMFIASLNHYTDSAVKQIEDHIKNLERACEQIDQVMQGITGDVRTLQKYVPLLYRLRDTLWPQ